MSYKPHPPACYVVAWDNAQIVKAGYSARQRWRDFQRTGARVVLLRYFTTSKRAIGLETQLDAYLTTAGEPAFSSGAAAQPYLGRHGGGWCECYLTPCPEQVLTQCVRIADAFCEGSALADARTRRTHELTESISPQMNPATNAPRAGGPIESGSMMGRSA